jgi:transposase
MTGARTYRFRIYPKKQQIKSMNSMLNLSRELYNAMLQQRIYAYQQKKIKEGKTLKVYNKTKVKIK